MDRITQSLLGEFSAAFDLEDIAEDKRFEHFAAYITVRREHSESFDTMDIVLGGGADTGIDAIAIIVNGALITDVDDFEEMATTTSTLDVRFIFVQAERSSSFEAAKIGTFGFGVMDFFKEHPTLARSADVQTAADIMAAIYNHSSKFKKSRPDCHLHYITTGTWTGDANLEARRASVMDDLKGTSLFGSIKFDCIGSDGVAKMYAASKNAVSRTIQFPSRVELPEIHGVKEAFLGYIPAKEFVELVRDEGDEILKTIFYDNVRDWHEYNKVNDEIRETLTSSRAEKFVLMNNGITLIAKDLQRVGSKFTLDDFQIVNGCQTSHVIFDQKDDIVSNVCVPLRIIVTQDDKVTEDIIKATNRQTQLKEDQFIALLDFSRKLEEFFAAFPAENRLYYERRLNQYNRLEVEKTRVVTTPNLIRAFASVFLSEPHRTTRNFKALLEKVGGEIFGPSHRMEAYYAAAYAMYKLEYMFRTQRLDSKYKPARFHLLLAARLLNDNRAIPAMNSNEIAKRSLSLAAYLSDQKRAEALFLKAAGAVDSVAKGNLHRDNVRTQPFTEALFKECGGPVNGPPQA